VNAIAAIVLMGGANENALSFASRIELHSSMRRSDLADLTAFLAIADRLSFRAAAERLGVTPSALSHKMRQLEERLDVRLLQRTTRSVSLTDAGLRLLERLRPALDQIAGALEDLDDQRHRPSGRLRLHTSVFGATTVIASMWSRFLMTYPEVQLEVEVGSAPVDIVAQGFDAAIGPRNEVPADMIAVRVMGPVKVAVVGAPAYFALRSPPRTPDDLERHNCIRVRPRLLAWQLEVNGKLRRIAVNGPVIVNNVDLAVRAAVDGLGIAYAVESVVEPFLRSGQLQRVLEKWSPSLEGVVLYYSGRRQLPAALRALIDMIRAPAGAPGARSSGRENSKS
jgi:DNA-binding transcriptional LysR family regulator